MAEFDLIDRIRSRAATRGDVVLGIGDDAAIVQVPAGRQLVVCTDTLNAGVHFPLDTAAADIGWKSLAVNLSDLAAMAAEPAWCTLSLSMPEDDPAWLDGFLDGFLGLAAQHGIALIGGDTTRGPLSISVTAHGLVAPGHALRRDGAQVGDDLWVTGTLGDAAAALALLLPSASPLPLKPVGAASPPSAESGNAEAVELLRPRLDRPTPRVAVGRRLGGLAHAGIDLSDGLLADLAHLCRSSGVAAEIELDALPCSPALARAFDLPQRRVLQAAGGDDYELCFSAPVRVRESIDALAARTATAITCIGRVIAGEGVRALDADGGQWHPPRTGYTHFSG
ncbi:MAG TPA: thiamine-phosphate kinase [Lysobacter sp.]|nr:thiamine-phosphate kinase [Lysobacter sp.]